MRILVFEFMVGGGVANQHPLDSELRTFYQQGHAMLQAVCEDLLQLGHEVAVPVDAHANASLPDNVIRMDVKHEGELDPTLLDSAASADHILLIAPESDGCLEHYANLLSSFSNRFISPNTDFICLASNKWKCHEWFSRRNIPCPDSLMLTDHNDIDGIPEGFFPCVAKPVDGAGSEGVRLVSSVNDLETISTPILLQRFVRGIAASVSVIAESSEKVHFLDPGQQVFDSEPFGVHVRTEFPLESNLRERALKLAKSVVDASPNFLGYAGIDMVLGEDPSDDVVIEINPRLTSSYCFLREWSKENLAEKFPIQARRASE